MRTRVVGVRVAALAAIACALPLSALLTTLPAFAIETGAPQLPPPPPPPMAPPSPPPKSGPSSPPPSQPAQPAQSGPTPTHATSSSSFVSESSSDSSGGALDTRWAIGAMLGFATDCDGFGLGVRGGKTLANHLYLGGSLVYQFMGCDVYTVPSGYSVSASTIYFGPEAGYDFDLKAVVLRAYVGIGPAFLNVSETAPGVNVSANQSEIVFWPGATVIWSIPNSMFYIGGDMRFVSVWNGPAVGFFFTGGLHFGT